MKFDRFHVRLWKQIVAMLRYEQRHQRIDQGRLSAARWSDDGCAPQDQIQHDEVLERVPSCRPLFDSAYRNDLSSRFRTRRVPHRLRE